MQIQIIPSAWVVSNCPQTMGTLTLEDYNKRDRTLRAAKVFGICWLLALMTLPIPGAHLFLPPVFLLTSPFAAWKTSQKTRVMVTSEGVCPKCNAQQLVKLGREEFRTPIRFACPKCHEFVRVDPQTIPPLQS